ncbi:hypothetical protein [Amycolatopsis sp. NPDC051903]|uniref:hypothetical protein n=1 Tax=Amycolatopsis sp. NPDC051903 TaxID=3363936 RepID=UPI0037898C48
MSVLGESAATWWLGGVIAASLLIRLLALVVALRGTKPQERPAIIRALGELFRLTPRRRIK